MEISKINKGMPFGKQALMTCYVKEKVNQKEHIATLYKMEPENSSDASEIFYSKHTNVIADDYYRARFIPGYNNKNFYLLKDDETGEVISCAQTSHHYRPDKLSRSGAYTLIEEADTNSKYENAFDPLLGYLAKQAVENYDNSIFTAFNENTVDNLKNNKFAKIKTGEYYLPQNKFQALINKAQRQHSTEYYA